MRIKLFILFLGLFLFVPLSSYSAVITFTDEFDTYATEADMLSNWDIKHRNYSAPVWDYNFNTSGRLTVTDMYHGTSDPDNYPVRRITYFYHYLPATVDGDFTLQLSLGWTGVNLIDTVHIGMSAGTYNISYVNINDFNAGAGGTGEFKTRVNDSINDILYDVTTPANSAPLATTGTSTFTISRINGQLKIDISVDNGAIVYSSATVPNDEDLTQIWFSVGNRENTVMSDVYIDSINFSGYSSTYQEVTESDAIPEPLTLIMLVASMSGLIVRRFR
ncbi:MAG: PEP-CTERM sorting domain-containing protein [Candidatus Auribacterota bacterium]|jgi:hypothetical protein|nr:PEP-CTERM sorting domain-containing protein [Candidatus Auribacterota bacterium]